MYAIVEFLGAEDSTRSEISLVPLSWLSKDRKSCYFPLSTKKLSFEQFVKQQVPYKRSWPRYKTSRIHFVIDNYMQAEKRLQTLLTENELEVQLSSDSSIKTMVVKETYNDDIVCSESSEEDENNSRKKKCMEEEFFPNKTIVDYEKSPQNVTAKENNIVVLENRKLVQASGSDLNKKVSDTCCTFPSGSRDSILSQNSKTSEIINDSTSQHADDEDIFGAEQTNGSRRSSVLSLITKTFEMVEQNTLVLAEISRQLKHQNVVKAPKDIPEFPLRTVAEFNAFENKLAETSPMSELLKSFLVRRLAAVGGSGVEQVTRRMMKFLITNKLGISFNWKGKDKISFEKTTLMGIIYDAAKLNFPVVEQSDKVVATTVANWLKLSKARAKVKT